MNQFDSLKEIWLSEKAEILPDYKEIKLAIKKYHTSKKRNIYILIFLTVGCILTMIAVVAFNPAKRWTTIFGELLIFIGFFLVLIFKIKTLKKANTHEMKSNKAFLEDLQSTILKKSKTNYFQLVTMLIIATGYGFYIYESVYTNKSAMLLSYLGILVFLLIMYFGFRPFAQNISRKKSKKLLTNIKKITKQLQS